MSELIPWMGKEMNKMRRDIDRLFNRCWADIGADLFMKDVSGGISIETLMTEEAFMITAVLPGINPESLDISVTDDKLTIKGSKKEVSVEGTGYYQRVERKLSSFSRTIPLPFRARIDEIKATLNRGRLSIVVPKWKPQKARCIKIETG
ncbi:MAG: Hsp20/alpha crystallin family protein [Pseudomonadota bacterium]|jgi:HSP20 family protein|nr:Hsp20/alpha crystallin family protein [Desulfobacterales bacterium]MBL6967893.1 Hsp20/alpha crystallin family protein [Desulfobacteraceae bacterium]MBU0735679.1 Hsp20/alpha crystallin family protein [Pseudomonadota bacterium]MBL7101765.1 Hsp20/alpha crystallin family protein [Desulfobacteraceae bacterium]MBL7172587.1 Hsp20/alpha crystallin family protein [Desulfobacteraceae bacterium]